jgi:hypothetical protein
VSGRHLGAATELVAYRFSESLHGLRFSVYSKHALPRRAETVQQAHQRGLSYVRRQLANWMSSFSTSLAGPNNVMCI